MARLAPINLKKIDALSALSEDERKRLLADIERARQLHSTHIRRAMADALNHIPWILRAPVKAIFK